MWVCGSLWPRFFGCRPCRGLSPCPTRHGLLVGKPWQGPEGEVLADVTFHPSYHKLCGCTSCLGMLVPKNVVALVAGEADIQAVLQ